VHFNTATLSTIASVSSAIGFSLTKSDFEVIRLLSAAVGHDHVVQFAIASDELVINFGICENEYQAIVTVGQTIESYIKDTTLSISEVIVPEGIKTSHPVGYNVNTTRKTTKENMQKSKPFNPLFQSTDEQNVKDAVLLATVAAASAAESAQEAKNASEETKTTAFAAEKAAKEFSEKLKSQKKEDKKETTAEDKAKFLSTTTGKVVTYGSCVAAVAVAGYFAWQRYGYLVHREGDTVVIEA
jgi:molecular chaperone DnaK (HSP70)